MRTKKDALYWWQLVGKLAGIRSQIPHGNKKQLPLYPELTWHTQSVSTGIFSIPNSHMFHFRWYMHEYIYEYAYLSLYIYLLMYFIYVPISLLKSLRKNINEYKWMNMISKIQYVIISCHQIVWDIDMFDPHLLIFQASGPAKGATVGEGDLGSSEGGISMDFEMYCICLQICICIDMFRYV